MFCALVWSRDSKFKWFEKVPKGALKGTSKGRNARVTGMDIEELQKKVVEFRDARDWTQQAMEYWPEWVKKKCRTN
jgi:hypothetical protein